MSHFTVLVTLSGATDPDKLDDALAAALAPYDEQLESPEPYREYEDGAAGDHWYIWALRRDLAGWTRLQEIGQATLRAELVKEFTKGYDPRFSPTDRAPDIRVDRELNDYYLAHLVADQLGNDITWAGAAKLYNEKYHMESPGGGERVLGKVNDADIDWSWLHVDDEGRAYTWSTANKNGLWDWWVTGGRWQRTLLAKPGVDRSQLVFGRSGSGGDNDEPHVHTTGALWCDGGRVRDLDFSEMRLVAANKDLDRLDAWEKVVAKHGTPPGWAELIAKVNAEEMTIDAARSLYNGHPAIRAALTWYGDCPVAEHGIGRDAIVERAALSAVPGFALVNLDGEWIAPGRMGWFGMSTETGDDKATYQRAVNRYLELDIDPDTFVILVDCHV